MVHDESVKVTVVLGEISSQSLDYFFGLCTSILTKRYASYMWQQFP